MPSPKPVTLTVGPNPNPGNAPQPLIVVDHLPTKAQIAAFNLNSTTNAIVAAGANPTKAEFDAVVTLANSVKGTLNNLITALKA